MEPKRYEIKTIRDFLQVPPDRLDACLAEFREYLEIARPAEQFMNLVASSALGKDEAKFITDGFAWVDDGDRNINVEASFCGHDLGEFEIKRGDRPS